MNSEVSSQDHWMEFVVDSSYNSNIFCCKDLSIVKVFNRDTSSFEAIRLLDCVLDLKNDGFIVSKWKIKTIEHGYVWNLKFLSLVSSIIRDEPQLQHQQNQIRGRFKYSTLM